MSVVAPLLIQSGIDVLPLVGPAPLMARWLRTQGVDEVIHSEGFPGLWQDTGHLDRLLHPARYHRCWQQVREEVGRLLDQRDIDVVLAAMPFSWLAATEAARARGIPVVWRAGGTRIHPLFKPLLRAWASLHPPDLLLCCGENVAATFGPLIPAPKAVVENGVPWRRLRRRQTNPSRYRPPEARTVVGFAGRLAPEKRPEDVIEMAARISRKRPGLMVLLAGEGSRRESCEALIHRRGLGHVVHLCGYVEDMPSFYRACDVLVLPSRSEGLPNTVLEAMAVGTPVVVSEAVAQSGVVRNQREGLVHPVGDVEALSACVSLLLDSELLRTALTRRAREHLRQRFDLDRSAAEIARLLHAVTAAAAPRGRGLADGARVLRPTG